MPQIIGRKPSPRAIIWGFNATESAQLADLFPTAVVTGSLSGLRLEEWDLIVARNGVDGQQPSHLFTITFGEGRLGRAAAMTNQIELALGLGTIATEFEVPDDLDPRVLRLVHSDLLPAVQRRSSNPYVVFCMTDGSLLPGMAIGLVRPFLTTTEPRVLAAAFHRGPDNAEAWALPEYVDKVAWITAAIAAWRTINPTRFPAGPDWRRDAAWRTPQEHRSTADLRDLDAEEQAERLAREARRLTIETALAAANAASDASERRLLTAQGAELVNAVLAALAAFGFAVRDMDESWPDGDKREDIRITSPDDPDWEAICEVRGYGAGAKLNDLLRISRFGARYLGETGKSPSASWYIANQFLNEDPATRPAILSSNPEEVATFGEGPGLCIDTRDILTLWIRVQAGEANPSDVRALLMASRGRFMLPDLRKA